jgi:hypothetical protein
MMTFNEIFEEIIHENSQNLSNFDKNSNSLFLKEEEDRTNTKKTQLLSVTINGIDEVYSVFKLDEKKHLFLMEHGLIKKGQFHKKCDFLVFCKIGKRNYILLIEMKSEKSDNIPEKIKSTKVIIAFLQELIQQYYYENIKEFKQVAILFDKKDTKGRAVNAYNEWEVDYKHQGFETQHAITEIGKFL